MTSFTERCIAALDKEIASLRLSTIEFKLAHGKYEEYQYAKVVQKGLLIELYIFVDEAGCALNGRDWKIFEKWDFSEDSELIQQFVDYVIRILIGGPGVKDNSRGWHGFSLAPKGTW